MRQGQRPVGARLRLYRPNPNRRNCAMILYFTQNAKPRPFMQRIYDRHQRIAAEVGQSMRAVVAEPFRDDDIVMDKDPEAPNYADLFQRVLLGLKGVAAREVVYLVEDDCLYPKEHFGLVPSNESTLYYNMNFAFMDSEGFFRIALGNIAVSQIFGTAKALRAQFKKKLAECMDARMSSVEPAGAGYTTGTLSHANHPVIDIRNGLNATWQPGGAGAPAITERPDTLPGWAPYEQLWTKYCGDIEPA